MSPILPPPLLADAVPITPGIFMIIIVVSACVYGAIVIFNYQSLRTRSTHRLSVVSVMLVVAGLLIGEASMGLTFDRDAPPTLKSIPGMLAIIVLATAACVALAAFVHCCIHRHRFRRGRKRALGSFIVALLGIGGLYGFSSATFSAGVHASKSKVDLLPETDAYGRPIVTPGSATPGLATPVPVAAAVETFPVPQVPLSTPVPVPISTPRPQSLLPRVVTP